MKHLKYRQWYWRPVSCWVSAHTISGFGLALTYRKWDGWRLQIGPLILSLSKI